MYVCIYVCMYVCVYIYVFCSLRSSCKHTRYDRCCGRSSPQDGQQAHFFLEADQVYNRYIYIFTQPLLLALRGYTFLSIAMRRHMDSTSSVSSHYFFTPHLILLLYSTALTRTERLYFPLYSYLSNAYARSMPTSVCGLQLLVYEALRNSCMRP